MTVVEKLSFNISSLVRAKSKDVDETKFEVINYGINLLISNSLKIIIIFAIAYFLHILSLSVITVVSFGVLRTFAGGVHSKSWIGCFFATSFTIFSICYLSIFLYAINTLIISFIIFAFCFTFLYIYVPSDHENKPIVSKKQIKKLRKTTFYILIIEFCIANLLSDPIVSNVILLSCLYVTIMILPITYKITGNKHGNFYFKDITN